MEEKAKVVLVTGASSGLGREFALSLAKRGYNVVATARRRELLQSLCADIQQLGVKASAVQLDVSHPSAAVDAAVEIAWQCFGRIDVLINNAGFRGTSCSRFMPCFPVLDGSDYVLKGITGNNIWTSDVHESIDLSEDEWNKVVTTNLRGAWLVSKAVGRRMRDAGQGGSIINISSIGGLSRGELPGGIAYNASKAGINTLTKVMALELGKYNIRVNSIAPGLFRSEITAGLMEKDWLNKVAERTVPLKTWGQIDPAMTSIVYLLASDSSAYITGNIFIVDGGATLPGVPLYSSL